MSEEKESFLEVSMEDGKLTWNLNFENELRKLIRRLVEEEIEKVARGGM